MSGIRMLKAVLILFTFVLAGCTSSATYNQSYEGPLVDAVPLLLKGKVLVYSTLDESNYVFRGGPSSFTGAATTLEISLGEITREISLRAFGRLFTDGAEYSSSLSRASEYAAIVNLRPSGFTYAYNQLQNIGFAVTPQASLSIELVVLKEGGIPIYRNTYDSGVIDGDTYVMSGSPSERINQVAHEAVTLLINRAAMDVYYLVGNSISP